MQGIRKFSAVTSSLKFEKLIFLFTAIFDGIGIAGIISAAFWYVTAPMAPDGFKGPIATVTIATSTIASLLISIPIAYGSYKKLIHQLEGFRADFLIELKHFDDSLDELYFDLLKLRSLANTDNEFMNKIKSLPQYQNIQLAALAACKVYSIFKNKYYFIGSNPPLENRYFENRFHDIPNNYQSIQFKELLNLNSLTHIKTVRKEIVKNTFKFILDDNDQTQCVQKQKHYKTLSCAFLTGITCTEVLLSIGWTVSSILIGIKVIPSISISSWLGFAFLCIVLGPIFGLGMYFNKLKQHNRDSLKIEMRSQNQLIFKVRETIDKWLVKKLLEQNNLGSKNNSASTIHLCEKNEEERNGKSSLSALL